MFTNKSNRFSLYSIPTERTLCRYNTLLKFKMKQKICLEMHHKQTLPQIDIVIDISSSSIKSTQTQHCVSLRKAFNDMALPFLTKFHAGYFRISLSLCSQALLWKTLGHPPDNAHAYRRMLGMLPTTAFILLWSLALLTLVSLSILYILKCCFNFKSVKDEFLNHVGVNYLFAPWISCLLLLQSAPFLTPNTICYQLLWWIFVLPILVLDVKIYGQWFTKGKNFLSTVANPASQLSVIGNLVGARAAALMGCKESAICLFSFGMVHYLVLFVTLYQRLAGSDRLPAMLRPVFFLFFAAPSMASLAWISISGSYDNSSKMLFFLSLFLFMSLVCRPKLFKKAMRRFNVAWWAYSFPLTVLALSSTEYAQEVKSSIAHLLMVILSATSVVVTLVLMAFTAVNTDLSSDSLISKPSADLILTTSGSSTE